MSSFFHIIAVLASGPEQPEGDPGQVLTLHAPLTGDAQLDVTAIREAGMPVAVELAVAGRVVWASRLEWVDGGWVIRLDGSEEGPVWGFKARVLRPGEYLTLLCENDREQGYRIVNVRLV